jgi:hypothetical protein
LLSRILKSLQQIIVDKISQVELPQELNMSLSFIESGCLAAELNNRTTFILKDTQKIIDLLKETNQILFGFECIKRPEFPSVRMYFHLKDKVGNPFQFDYFFGIESDEEMKLLGKLKGQDYFDILFFSSKIEYIKRVEITEKDKERIKAALDKAIS